MTATDYTHPSVDVAKLEEQVAKPADRSMKADVLAELGSKVSREVVEYLVPDRPGYSVKFSPMFDADELREHRKHATGNDGEVDQFALALRALVSQCVVVVRQGVDLELDGKAVTFRSPEFLELYGAMDAPSAVRAFYGVDTMVANVYARLLEEASAGSLDPTQG